MPVSETVLNGAPELDDFGVTRLSTEIAACTEK